MAPLTRKNGTDDPPPANAQANGSETVFVGLKWPTSVILQLSVKESEKEPVLGALHREVEVWKKRGPQYVVKGTAIPAGTVSRTLQVGGYAFTAGIPKDFWDQWKSQNFDNFLVTDNLIIALPSVEAAETEAQNCAKLRTWVEPFDPNKVHKIGRGRVETADEQKADTAKEDTPNWFSPSQVA